MTEAEDEAMWDEQFAKSQDALARLVEDHAASLRSVAMSAFTTKRLIARKSVRELVAEAQVNIDADLARRTRSFAIESHDADDPAV